MTMRAPGPTPGLKRTRAPFELGCSTLDRKSTRLNSSHSQISYAAFCLKKNEKWISNSLGVWKLEPFVPRLGQVRMTVPIVTQARPASSSGYYTLCPSWHADRNCSCTFG